MVVSISLTSIIDTNGNESNYSESYDLSLSDIEEDTESPYSTKRKFEGKYFWKYSDGSELWDDEIDYLH